MQAGKVEPSVVSFGAMMDACAKAGQPLKAIEWHRAMLKNLGYAVAAVAGSRPTNKSTICLS